MTNTIKLKKYFDVIEEIEASGTITPGMLLELGSDGKVKAHDTSAGVALPMFALEDELQGNDIDDDYSSGDMVQVWIPQRGEQVLARLQDDETVVIGDFLTSHGNGRLKKYSGDIAVEDSDVSDLDIDVDVPRQSIVAQALEAVDLDTSTGVWPSTGRKIKVRIM